MNSASNSANVYNRPQRIKDLEDELNKYPIKGFKFGVQTLDVWSDIGLYNSSATVKAKIVALYDPKYGQVDQLEVLTWFYLALDAYAKDIDGNEVEITYRNNGKTVDIYAEVTIRLK